MNQTRPPLPHELPFAIANSMNAALRPPARETLDVDDYADYDDDYDAQLYADERAVTVVKKPVAKRNSEIDILARKVDFREEGAMLIGDDRPRSHSPRATTDELAIKFTPKAKKVDISDMLGFSDDHASHKNR